MSVELQQIKEVLAGIEGDCQEGVKAFHFSRLTSLTTRAEARSPAIQQKLLPEIEKGLSQLNSLLSKQDFPEDDALDAKPSSSVFQELIDRINSFDVNEIEKASLGLDALLFDLGDDQSESSDSMSSSSELSKSQLPKTEKTDKFRARAKELKSLQFYREQLGKVITENMVRQVIKEDPENAGPLNPQRLLVRTIGAMKDISPAYVNRLVPYYDTLLWLEQAGEGKSKR
jgi:hypothetical protein